MRRCSLLVPPGFECLRLTKPEKQRYAAATLGWEIRIPRSLGHDHNRFHSLLAKPSGRARRIGRMLLTVLGLPDPVFVGVFTGSLGVLGSLLTPSLLAHFQATRQRADFAHNHEQQTALLRHERWVVDRDDLRTAVDSTATAIDALCDSLDHAVATISPSDEGGGPQYNVRSAEAWAAVRALERHRLSLTLRLGDEHPVVASASEALNYPRETLRTLDRATTTGSWGDEEFAVLKTECRDERWARRDRFVKAAYQLASSEALPAAAIPS